MIIFLVGGKAGEGKTTFAIAAKKYLEDYGDVGYFPFAKGVKDTARFMGWDGEKDEKGRTLLQAIGGSGRDYDPDTWVNMVVDEIFANQWLDFVFVDDWRFPNEEKVMREQFDDVVTIRIRRPEDEHLLIGTPMYNDPSETSLSEDDEDYDFVIPNYATEETLEETAKELMYVIVEEDARGLTGARFGRTK